MPSVTTGVRIAAVAKKLGVHPVAPKGPTPNKFFGVTDLKGDYYDAGDILEAMLKRIEQLEGKSHGSLYGRVSDLEQETFGQRRDP
jgi:hypothetical protein